MKNRYTFGIKAVSGDAVLLFNMTEHEARAVAASDKQFKFAYIDQRKYKPQSLADHDKLKRYAA
jgi:hypothetical protein